MLTRLINEGTITRELFSDIPIASIHYVDSGLGRCNCSCFPINSELAIRCLSEYLVTNHVELHLHGTPRQWLSDVWRAVSHDKDAFVKALIQRGVVPHVKWYFATEEESLDMHFRVLDVLKIVSTTGLSCPKHPVFVSVSKHVMSNAMDECYFLR